ncbi:hypothetical protein MSG28_012987 [Choristoneura fumiferana]|uniref:Uncharacterized protein n=1 Tax=Choristoneura fumiferana TaxID=7141 RepID=A0ACC0KRH3_CHOFU|nr:hypothetical protein MSG28_012987 [Choristoneura fumiferana]
MAQVEGLLQHNHQLQVQSSGAGPPAGPVQVAHPTAGRAATGTDGAGRGTAATQPPAAGTVERSGAAARVTPPPAVTVQVAHPTAGRAATGTDGAGRETAGPVQGALNDSIASNSHLKDENTLLKAQVSAAKSLPSQPNDRSKEYEARLNQLTLEVTRLDAELAAAREAERRAGHELDKTKKDQDDLLELLADQDMKINEYKTKLASLGHPVEDDAPTEPSLT